MPNDDALSIPVQTPMKQSPEVFRETVVNPSGMRLNVKMATTNLNAFFGKPQALKPVSLNVPSNRVLAIIGPSGRGKSTYLRCLNRMHEVAGGTLTGSVTLDGEDVLKYDPVVLRRRVGMVFQ